MHPTPQFAWSDRQGMLEFVHDQALCTIFVEGPHVIHVPVLVAGGDRIRFHVFKANRAARALDGARALLSCIGPTAYISPDWYGTEDQVPTWNYVAVEAEGPLRRLERPELILLLDELSSKHEERLAPKPPWTRGKMRPGLFESLLKAIEGFELGLEELRGTRKLGQHKSAEERHRAANAVAGAGNPEFAELMRNAGVMTTAASSE